MKRIAYIVFFALFSTILAAAQDIPPQPGFEWRKLAKGSFELQVPQGWRESSKPQGIVEMFYLSPEENLAHGFNTGFTLNFIRCKNKKEMNDAEGSALLMLKEHGEAFGKPLKEKVIDSEDMTYLMLEGERFLERSRTRTRNIGFALSHIF